MLFMVNINRGSGNPRQVHLDVRVSGKAMTTNNAINNRSSLGHFKLSNTKLPFMSLGKQRVWLGQHKGHRERGIWKMSTQSLRVSCVGITPF